MRRGEPAFDGEHAVEQKHTLPRPAFEIAVGCLGDTEVGLEFLVDVFQRWRRAHVRLHRKAQTMRLTVAVIGVLAENDDLDLIERRQIQRCKIFRRFREDLFPVRHLGFQECPQLGHVGAFELPGQSRFPARIKLDGGVQDLLCQRALAWSSASLAETHSPAPPSFRCSFFQNGASVLR